MFCNDLQWFMDDDDDDDDDGDGIT